MDRTMPELPGNALTGAIQRDVHWRDGILSVDIASFISGTRSTAPARVDITRMIRNTQYGYNV